MKILPDTPKTWKLHPIGSFVSELESGVSVNSSELDGDRSSLILKTSCVSTGRFDVNEAKPVVRSELGRLRCPVRKGSIIISRMNTPDLVGANAYVSAEVSGVYLPDRLWQAIWKEDAQLDPRWLAQILASSAGRTFLKSIASGTSDSMKNISKEAFLSAEVPTPPLPEQRKIAEILTAWDDALEKLDALIAAKERRKKALMQQLLSGKMRGSECSGKWITAKLGDLFTERVEQNRPDLDLLSITADRGIVRRDGLAKRDTSSEDKSKYLRIAPGDIGYNTMRMWQGVSAVSALEGIVSPAYTICTPTKGIDVRFAAHLFKFRHTIHLFHRYSQGLVDDTLNLKFPVFAAIEVFIPADIEAQRRIAAILDTCDDELRLRRAQRAALDQQKRGLMQKLLTGQLRVHA